MLAISIYLSIPGPLIDILVVHLIDHTIHEVLKSLFTVKHARKDKLLFNSLFRQKRNINYQLGFHI